MHFDTSVIIWIVNGFCGLVAAFAIFRFSRIERGLDNIETNIVDLEKTLREEGRAALSSAKSDIYSKIDQVRDGNLGIWQEIHKVKDHSRDRDIHIAENYVMKKDLK